MKEAYKIVREAENKWTLFRDKEIVVSWSGPSGIYDFIPDEIMPEIESCLPETFVCQQERPTDDGIWLWATCPHCNKEVGIRDSSLDMGGVVYILLNSGCPHCDEYWEGLLAFRFREG